MTEGGFAARLPVVVRRCLVGAICVSATLILCTLPLAKRLQSLPRYALTLYVSSDGDQPDTAHRELAMREQSLRNFVASFGSNVSIRPSPASHDPYQRTFTKSFVLVSPRFSPLLSTYRRVLAGMPGVAAPVGPIELMSLSLKLFILAAALSAFSLAFWERARELPGTLQTCLELIVTVSMLTAFALQALLSAAVDYPVWYYGVFGGYVAVIALRWIVSTASRYHLSYSGRDAVAMICTTVVLLLVPALRLLIP